MTQLTYDLTELGDVSPAIPPIGLYAPADCGNDFESSASGLKFKFPYRDARATNYAAWFFDLTSAANFIKVSMEYSLGATSSIYTRPCVLIRNKTLSDSNIFSVELPYAYNDANKVLTQASFGKSVKFATSGNEERLGTAVGYGTIIGPANGLGLCRTTNPDTIVVDVYIDKTGKGIAFFIGDECLGQIFQPNFSLDNIDIGFGLYNFNSTALHNANMFIKSISFDDEITEVPDYYFLPINFNKFEVSTSDATPSTTVVKLIGKEPLRRVNFNGVPLQVTRVDNVTYNVTNVKWQTLIGNISYPENFNSADWTMPGDGLQYFTDTRKLVTSGLQSRTSAGVGVNDQYGAARLTSIGVMANSLGTFYKKEGVPATLTIGSILVYPSGAAAPGLNIQLTHQYPIYTGSGIFYYYVFDYIDSKLRRFGVEIIDNVVTEWFEANHDLALFHRSVGVERNAMIESTVFTMDARHQLAGAGASFWLDAVEIAYNSGSGWEPWAVYDSENPLGLNVGWSYKARMKSPVGYSRSRRAVLHVTTDPTNTFGRFDWIISTADRDVGDPVFVPDLSMTSEEILFELVKHQNPGEGQGLINSDYVYAQTPVATTDLAVGNTTVPLRAVADSGVTGTVHVTYDRLDVSHLVDELVSKTITVEVPYEHDATTILDAINAQLETNFSLVDFQVDTYEAFVDDVPYASALSAQDSVVWTGDFIITVAPLLVDINSFITVTDLDGLNLPE